MACYSVRLRSEDWRSIYLLVGECCELGADPVVWRRHLLTTLNRRFGAVASVDIEASVSVEGSRTYARVDTAMSLDQFDRREREILTRCLREMPVEANPLGVELIKDCARLGPIAATRRQRVADDTWEKCEFMTEYFAPLGWEDVLVGVAPIASGIRFYNFSKVRGDRPFTARDARVLQLLLLELGQISAERLTPFSAPSINNLPDRLRQVLLALADGDAEKQIALRLAVSRSTVHEYIRRLFSRFGATSRGQLLVRAAQLIRAAQLASEQDAGCWVYRAK